MLQSTLPAHASFWRESEQKAIEVQDQEPTAAIEMYRLAIKDAAAENAPIEKRLGLLLSCGDLLYVNDRVQEARDIYQEGASLAEQNVLKNWQARFLVMLSRNAHEAVRLGLETTNDPAPALKALELRPEDPNTSTDFRVTCLQAIGDAYLDSKDYANAEKYLKQALAESDRMPDEQERVDEITRSFLQLRIAQHNYAGATALLVASAESHPSEMYWTKQYYFDELNKNSAQDASVYSRVHILMKKHDFAGLDAYANELRADQTPTIDGYSPINTFLNSIDLAAHNTESQWKERIGFVNDWIAAEPQSGTARIVLADILTTYAWKARGGGWASDVTEQAWYLFKRRLDDAWRQLYKATPRTPEWYSVAQTVALGKGWNQQQYDAIFAAARKAFPNYNPVLFNKAYWLQPKWYGKPGEAKNFVTTESNKRPGVAGDILYAQFAMHLGIHDDYETKGSDFDWSRVKRGLQALIKQHPASLHARGELAYLAAQAGDKATALTAFPGQTNFEAPIKMRPRGYFEAYEQGRRDQHDDKRAAAIADYTKAIASDPKGGEAYFRRAEMYVMTNRSDEALSDINKCLSMYPAWAPALAERGRIENLREEYSKSIADIEKVLAQNPTETEGLSTLGHDYDEMGDHQRALNVANHDLELTEQKQTQALYYSYQDRGLVWSNAHQYDQALNDLSKGIQLRREWSQLWAYLAYIYAATDQINKAEEAAKVLFALESFPPRGYRLRAEIYRGAGLWERALADYNQSTSLEPTYGPGFWQRAVTKIALGRYDIAEPDLNKSVTLRPTSALAYSYLALDEDLLGKSDLAQTHIAKAFALMPHLPINYINRARIEYHHGNLAKAAADCNQALGLDPYSADAYATAAAVLTSAGKHDAAQAFDKSAKTMWWHPWQVPLPAPTKIAESTDISITMPTLTELKAQPFMVATKDSAP
ncbi:MAG TPA: tetratricopeptide repeat protein [Candidatus Obscuribacterales bacterium]